MDAAVPVMTFVRTDSTRERLFLAVFLAVAVLAAYWPALHGGFVFDDEQLLGANRLVQARDGLHQIWFSAAPIDYWPLTNSSFWIEWRLWGADTLGYHLTNVALHIASAMLVWALLRRLAVPGAYLGALVFALHPVNVQSVAWIAQRKNTLAMVFFLVSLLWYVRAERLDVTRLGPDAEKPPKKRRGSRTQLASADRQAIGEDEINRRSYWISFLAFVLAMLSKGSVAMLPALLFLLVWWRRGVIRWSDVRRTTPFFAVAVGLTLVNVWFQRRDVESIRDVSFVERLLGTGGVIWFYLAKALVPVNLLFAYPQWQVHASTLVWWLPLAGAAGLTLVLWLRRARRTDRALLVAWLFFCGSLVPVMGLTDVYFMKYSLVANHYEYIAVLAVAGAVGAGVAALPSTALRRVTSAAIVCALGVACWSQSRLYADAETLYRATLAGNPSAWFVRNNLGVLLIDRGNLDEGFAQLREAVRLDADPLPAKNLCFDAARANRFDEAIDACAAAIRLDPRLAEAHDGLGLAFMAGGRLSDAEREFETALRLDAADEHAHYNLAHLLVVTGRPNEALSHYTDVLRADPSSAAAHNGRGEAFRDLGERGAAEQDFRAAIAARPAFPEAHRNLGDLLLALGRTSEAATEYSQLIALTSGSAEAHNNLGVALTRLGRLEEARDQFQAAVDLQPDYADARNNLARISSRLAGQR